MGREDWQAGHSPFFSSPTPTKLERAERGGRRRGAASGAHEEDAEGGEGEEGEEGEDNEAPSERFSRFQAGAYTRPDLCPT